MTQPCWDYRSPHRHFSREPSHAYGTFAVDPYGLVDGDVHRHTRPRGPNIRSSQTSADAGAAQCDSEHRVAARRAGEGRSAGGRRSSTPALAVEPWTTRDAARQSGRGAGAPEAFRT